MALLAIGCSVELIELPETLSRPEEGQEPPHPPFREPSLGVAGEPKLGGPSQSVRFQLTDNLPPIARQPATLCTVRFVGVNVIVTPAISSV